MVLHYVSQRACAVKISSATANALTLSDSNLHVVDIVTIPNRLHQTVGETKHQQILNRFFSQVMINPINLFFLKVAMQVLVELPRRC